MKFHDYESGWELFKRTGLDITYGWKSDGEAAEAMLRAGTFIANDPIALRHCVFTARWRRAGSPYYDVYPSIIKMLSSVSLDFPGDAVQPPMGIHHLLLRLPCQEHDLPEVRTIFVSFQTCNREVGKDISERGLVVGLDVGERIDVNGVDYPIFTLRIFPLDERTIEKTVNELPCHHSYKQGKKVSEETIDRCVRTAVAICMLQDDPSILEPQVLSKDEYRVNEENRDRLVAKAMRRGKFGFSLGKGIEVIPHIRRPHPALVWTGKGRTVPRIVFRRGSVIHREIIEKIPTGREES